MDTLNSTRLSVLVLTLLLTACGGGDDAAPQGATDAAPASDQADRAAHALAVADAQRIAAVTATAKSEANACAGIRPFYWEMGNRDARLASGAVAAANGAPTYVATTQMAIASATKWIYGAFVAQRASGRLTDTDRRFLTMRSGYVSLENCEPGQTVDGCLAYQGNGAYSAESDGLFNYDGGHMQKHGSLTGLGAMNNKALTQAVRTQIGTDLKLAFSRPQLGGGIVTSADAYGRFLRKVLAGQLHMAGLLGQGAACTNPLTCGPDQAQYTPVPAGETWHYSFGHWVEDDPVVGDGAYSSAGSYGFYPWIDAGKTSYGVIARVDEPGSGYESALCGRLLRKAWVSGVAY